MVAGFPSYNRTDSALTQLYGLLPGLGIEVLDGRSVRDRLGAIFAEFRHGGHKTWWSMYVAEALMRTGERWDGHPLLEGVDDAARRKILEAMDSTAVVDLENGELIGHPNNYWIVMARLELARRKLGVTDDRRVFDLSLEKTGQVLCEGEGFLDDDHLGRGRYDNYTFDALMTAKPLWGLLPEEGMKRTLASHERLLRAAARPDGLGLTWGRSAEFSQVWRMKLALSLVEIGATDQPELLAGLAADTIREVMRTYWSDDAVTAHRRGMTHWYRGEQRLLEFSLGWLGYMAEIAGMLQAIAAKTPDLACQSDPATLYPRQDTFVQMDPRGLGAWFYRDGQLDFQLPVVNGYTSDYAAFVYSPGVLEQPVDSFMTCGVPNAFYGKRRYLPLRAPKEIRHADGELSWVTDCFSWFERHDWWTDSDDKPGRREVTVRVADGRLEIAETWRLDEVPDKLAIFVAESRLPLSVSWECSAPSQATTTVVEGMREWRSYWNGHTRVHCLDIEPAGEVDIRYVIEPAR